MRFANRAEAGRQLAEQLQHLRGSRPVVLALPRGGVPIGVEIARALDAPLDVLIVRKLGAPQQPELALGALGESGVRVLNDRLVEAVGATEADLAAVQRHEAVEIERRRAQYRHGQPMVDVAGRTAIIVDDGLATGATARAAVEVARALDAARVVVAVPVGAADSLEEIARHADEVIAASTPANFAAVGAWYDDFRQVSDDEVEKMLDAPGASSPRS